MHFTLGGSMRAIIVLKPRLINCKETIDIGTNVDYALSARRAAAQRGLDGVRIEQLPIYGMTKDAALALRYRLFDSGVVRPDQTAIARDPPTNH